MSTAIVTTDSVFGPWIIPSRAQTMITNNYAHSKGITVDAIIPEPLFSTQFSTTRWSMNSKDLTRILLCSIHQLPQAPDTLDDFVADLQDVELHFCLEYITGKGDAFLRGVIEEARLFQNENVIEYQRVASYDDMFKMLQEQGL